MQLWREVTPGTAILSFRLTLEEFLENSPKDGLGEKGKSHTADSGRTLLGQKPVKQQDVKKTPHS